MKKQILTVFILVIVVFFGTTKSQDLFFYYWHLTNDEKVIFNDFNFYLPKNWISSSSNTGIILSRKPKGSGWLSFVNNEKITKEKVMNKSIPSFESGKFINYESSNNIKYGKNSGFIAYKKLDENKIDALISFPNLRVWSSFSGDKEALNEVFSFLKINSSNFQNEI